MLNSRHIYRTCADDVMMIQCGSDDVNDDVTRALGVILFVKHCSTTSNSPVQTTSLPPVGHS